MWQQFFDLAVLLRGQTPQSPASSLGHITVTEDVPRRNSMRISGVAATATGLLATGSGSVLKITGTNACVGANRMKVLMHDGFGLWLCARRLHQGSLHWPKGAQPRISLNAQQWQALTVGLPWRKLDSEIGISVT